MVRTIIADGERDGEQHYHKNGEKWGVIGKWGDKQHLVTKNHRSWNLSLEGRQLHTQHIKELNLERVGKKWKVITSDYSGTCRRCKRRFEKGTQIQWRPNRGGEAMTKCAPSTACDNGEYDDEGFKEYDELEEDETADEPKKKTRTQADKGDFERFDTMMEQMGVAVNEAKEQAAKAEERADDAENATRDALDLLDKAREIVVVHDTPGKKKQKVKLGLVHTSFVELLETVQDGNNVCMIGDAGSGKTHAPRQIAEAIKLKFWHIPIGPQTSKSDLLGFINGAGKYVPSLLRRVYEEGGIALIDEMDAANSASLTIINGMLDSLVSGFADGMVERHPDAHFIAAMNTYGRGADMIYVGRAQLDAATLNRWEKIEWDTDFDLTRKLVKNDVWVNYVQALYNSIARQKVRHIIGMRTAIMGGRRLAKHRDPHKVEHRLIWIDLKEDDRQKVEAGVSGENDMAAVAAWKEEVSKWEKK